MSFIVQVSPEERAAGVLNRETAVAAYQALFDNGALLLRGCFSVEVVDALQAEFMSRYGGRDLAQMQALAQQPPPSPVLPVGGSRFELAVRMNGLFGDPSFFANSVLLQFLWPLLGTTMRLSGTTAVAAFPGADMQHIHRDYPHLYPDYENLGPQLPIYAINASVPLIDVDMQMGPTAFWPGSHRQNDDAPTPPDAMVSVPFQRGDCFMIDFRCRHAGMPNRSSRMRPILYLAYARDWFFDAYNNGARIPLDISLEQLKALPPSLQPLLARAFAQAHVFQALEKRDGLSG